MMWFKLLVLASVGLLSETSIMAAEQIATTQDGRKVVLKDDGTWSYVKSATLESPTKLSPEDPRFRNMTDVEKIRGWKGEKVSILGSSLDFVKTIYTGCENKGREFPVGQYQGKVGVIEEVISSPSDANDLDLIVNLDETGEKVRFCYWSYLGFFPELEYARQLVGQTLWTKGVMHLAKDCSDFKRSQDTSFKVGNMIPLQVLRADWGGDGYPVFLTFRTPMGEEGCFNARSRLLSRFTTGSDVKRPAYLDSFYFSDPRKEHPKWQPEIWALIEEGKVAIGMTEDMARLACGEGLQEVGAVVFEKEPVGTIFQGCGKKFLVQSGKVIKYVD